MLQTLACILLSLAAFTQAQNAVGLNSNGTTACSTQCSWSDPTIWTTGVVPGPGDAVTIQNSAAFNLIIDIPAYVYQFSTTDQYKTAATVTINSGQSLTVTQASAIAWTTTVTVQAGANFTSLSDLQINGIVVVQGNLSAAGRIQIATTDIQSATQKPVYATVQLQAGSFVVGNSITTSSTANLIGSGTVIGSVSNSGTISMGTSTSTGTMYIIGALDTSYLGGSSEIYVKIASTTDFDHLIMSGQFTQAGDLYVTPLNGFEPLNYQSFIVCNHTSQVGGFSTVRGTGFSGIFNNQWKVQVDQTYTAVRYGSASNVAISFFVLAACALLSSL